MPAHVHVRARIRTYPCAWQPIMHIIYTHVVIAHASRTQVLHRHTAMSYAQRIHTCHAHRSYRHAQARPPARLPARPHKICTWASISEAQKCPWEEVTLVFVPLGTPVGHPSNEKQTTPGPVSSPLGDKHFTSAKGRFCAYPNQRLNTEDPLASPPSGPLTNHPSMLGWHYLSNATCLIRPHLFCALFSVKDHHNLLSCSSCLKKHHA